MDEVTDGNVWEIRVPRDRLAVLIGRNGDTKRELEEKAGIALEIDSREGDVTVIQKGDPLKAALSISVIQAIARGFSPHKAFFLFEENSLLIVISLREFAKPGSHRIAEIKGRIIGTGGKTRKVMEELTNTSISVYGDTVSVMGDYVSVEYAREALTMLINGSRQRTVYTYLEKNAKNLRLKRIEETFG